MIGTKAGTRLGRSSPSYGLCSLLDTQQHLPLHGGTDWFYKIRAVEQFISHSWVVVTPKSGDKPCSSFFELIEEEYPSADIIVL